MNFGANNAVLAVCEQQNPSMSWTLIIKITFTQTQIESIAHVVCLSCPTTGLINQKRTEQDIQRVITISDIIVNSEFHITTRIE